MAETGLLVEVRWEWDGTETVADSALGTDTITVLDPDTLSIEDTIWIGGEGPYVVTEIVDDVVTIDPVLAADVDEGEPVVPDAGGGPGQIWLADVILPDADQPVEVQMTIHDLIVMPEGIYDPPKAIALEDDLSAIIDLPGNLPSIQGSLIAPGTLPPDVTEVVAPGTSPVPTISGGIGVLLVRWDPIVGGSDFLVQVHLSTNPAFVAVLDDPDTLVGTTNGTQFWIRNQADGSDLEYIVPNADPLIQVPRVYYVSLIAYNTDGEAAPSAVVSGSMMQITGPDIAVNAIWAGRMNVSRLDSGDLFADVALVGSVTSLGTSGRKVWMDSRGFHSQDIPPAGEPEGRTLVDFPNDGAPNVITGRTETDALVVNTGGEFHGTSHIVSGAKIIYDSGVQPPAAAPIVIPGYQKITLADTSFVLPEGDWYGLCIGHDGRWYRALDSDGYGSFIYAWEADGGIGDIFPVFSDDKIRGWTYAGGFYYALVLKADGNWWVYGYDTDGGFASSILVNGLGGNHTIGTDHTAGVNRVLVGQRNTSTGIPTVKSYDINISTGALTFAINWTPTGSYDYDLGYVARGVFDYGADRYVLRARQASSSVLNFRVYNTSAGASYNASEIWPAADVNYTSGGWFDGTRFYSVNTGRTIRRYEKGRCMWTSGTDDHVWKYTWYDSAGTTHETTGSPEQEITMLKRQRVTITTSAIPANGADDPDSVRIYSKLAGGTFAREVTTPETVWTLDSVVAAETGAVPGSNTFPDSTPSEQESSASDGDGPLWEFHSDGFARIADLLINTFNGRDINNLVEAIGDSERTSDLTGYTSETLSQVVTFDAVAGAKYEVTANFYVQAGTINNFSTPRLRHSATATGIGGTMFKDGLLNHGIANRKETMHLIGDFTYSGTDGDPYTVKLTIDCSGTGTSQASATSPAKLYVKRTN